MEVIVSATSNAGVVAALAEEREPALYGNLLLSHYFVPVAFETSGVNGPQSRLLLKKLDHRIKITGEAMSAIFLLQHLSVAVQKDNVASVLGNISRSKDLELYFNGCFLGCLFLFLV